MGYYTLYTLDILEDLDNFLKELATNKQYVLNENVQINYVFVEQK